MTICRRSTLRKPHEVIARFAGIFIFLFAAVPFSEASEPVQPILQTRGDSQKKTARWSATTSAEVILDLREKISADEWNKIAGGASEVKSIFASGDGVDDQFVDLCISNDLEVLVLNRTKVTDAGIAHLARAANLNKLEIHRSEISGFGLKKLARFENLFSIDLSECPITDDGVEELSGIERLREVDLSSTRITGQAIKSLAKISWLTTLRLHDTEITANDLRILAGHPRLAEISTPNIPGDDVLKSLKGCRKLRSLYGLRDFSDDGLRLIVNFEELDSIELDNGAITANGIRELAKHPFLKRIDTGKLRVTDEIAMAISELRTLESISISNLESINALNSLSQLDEVRCLYVQNFRDGDGVIAAAARFTKLRELGLLNCQFNDDALSGIERLPNLRRLDFYQSNISDRCIERIVKLPNIESINFTDTAVSETGILRLQEMPQLLRVTLPSQIGYQTRTALRRANRHLQVLPEFSL